MLNSIYLSLRYIEISVRGQMQYRASFIMLSIGHLLGDTASSSSPYWYSSTGSAASRDGIFTKSRSSTEWSTSLFR